MGQDGKADPAPLGLTDSAWMSPAALPAVTSPPLRACRLLAAACVLLIAACSSGHSPAGTDAVADRSGGSGQAAVASRPPAPAPGTPDPQETEGESAELADDPSGPATGTVVGKKVQQLRGELGSLETSVNAEANSLQNLRASTQASAADYFNSVAAINARLQVGTTTGNPILVAQWNQAQGKLDTLSGDVGALNGLSNEIAGSASQGAYLLEAVRATYGLSGAVDEDHVELGKLEDDVNRSVVKIDRLLNQVAGDLNRQSTYVGTERRNLQTLALAINNGEMYGQSLANRPYVNTLLAPGEVPARVSTRGGAPGARPSESGKPLVVIRFEKENVNYQHAVYQAVGQALDRYPQASFDVVAVSPAGSNAAEAALAASDAKRNADAVARTLTEMGLPSARIGMSAASAQALTSTEVRIYVH